MYFFIYYLSLMSEHIFWNTDEISFGLSPRKQNLPWERNTSHVPPSRPKPAPRKPGHSISKEKEYDIVKALSVSSLDEMLHAMKKTFFPTTQDFQTRLVLLSDVKVLHPMSILRCGDATFLFHTGFSSIISHENVYQAFPDLRLAYSEKDRLQGWIIPEDDINVATFLAILPVLGYPPIYANRWLIAKIRSEILDETVLLKCRFFELFTPSSPERVIGDLRIEGYFSEDTTHLVIHTPEVTILDMTSWEYSLKPLSSRWDICIIKREESQFSYIYKWKDEICSPGNIIMFDKHTSKIHELSFTLDVFYFDEKSVGLLAWYTLDDRKVLAKNWVLTFVIEEDHERRAIQGHIYIDSRWFLHAHEMMRIHKELVKWIRFMYEKTILANRTIERPELVQILRREVTKHAFLLTGRTPMIMPVILEQ